MMQGGMMSLHYSEQDTERAREAERAAGLAPNPSGATMYPAPTQASSRNNPLALGMIAIGVLMLVARMSQLQVDFEAGMVLFTIASCFLFFSFWKRIYGLLIPGCILAGLSVGVTFVDITDGVSVLWGLALGFLSIKFVGQALFGTRGSWPAIPAVILFAVGILVAATNLPGLFAGGLVWLPLLLIGLGLYLGWGRRIS
jgi:hypothetical protein